MWSGSSVRAFRRLLATRLRHGSTGREHSMDCVNHQGVAATAYCQNCGKPLCATCVRNAGNGQILCEPWVMACQSVQQRFMQQASGPNPSVAAVLGIIPGVGAMYNGQYF